MEVPFGRNVTTPANSLAPAKSLLTGVIPPDECQVAIENAVESLVAAAIGSPPSHWISSGFESIELGIKSLLLRHWIDLPVDQAEVLRFVERTVDSRRDSVSPSNRVLLYLAARMSHLDSESASMLRLAASVRQHDRIRSYDDLAMYYLALFGVVDYTACRPIPPVCLLLAEWCPGSMRRHSMWSSAVCIPLSLLWADRPYKRIDPAIVHEVVRLVGPRFPSPQSVTIRCIRWAERWRLYPLRRVATDNARRWLQSHITPQSGLLGSLDATILACIALQAAGLTVDSSSIQAALAFLRRMGLSIGPRESVPGRTAVDMGTQTDGSTDDLFTASYATATRAPTIDTALAIRALPSPIESASRSPGRAAVVVRRGIEWLLEREITESSHAVNSLALDTGETAGGWSRSDCKLGGDATATSMVLLALRQQFAQDAPSSLVTDDSMVAIIYANSMNLAHQQIALLDRVAAASRRARNWLLAMQNADGGWGHARRHVAIRPVAALARGTYRSIAPHIPAEDASTSAVTGSVLIALGAWEMGCGQLSVDRAVSFFRASQKTDGRWPEAHDAGAIESTAMAIQGLRSVGIVRRDSAISRAADWMVAVQNSDGGWGDTVPHDAEASDIYLTSLAILALIDAGRRDGPAVTRGVQFLLSRQYAGSWKLSGLAISGRNGLASHHTSVTLNSMATLALMSFIKDHGKPGPVGRSSRTLPPHDENG